MTAPATASAVEDFVAISQIRTNLARHSRGVDRNDLALLNSVYTLEATVSYGMFEGPAAQFAAFLTESMAGGPVTLHRTANMLVHVDGDRARSESYVIAYTRTAEAAGPARQRLIGGRYLDQHVRTEAGWRIAHRTYVLDWNSNRDDSEVIASAVARGGHRQDDPSADLFPILQSSEQGDVQVSTLDDALAKQALHDLLARYSRGIDRGSEEMLAAVFHPDAEVITGVVDGKAPEFVRDIIATVKDTFRKCFHSIANEYFEVSGDKAAGETYVIAYSATLGDAAQEIMTGGRYLDRFEKRDGCWRIAQRRFVTDWVTKQPLSMETNGMYESLVTCGGWAPNDPSMALFLDRVA